MRPDEGVSLSARARRPLPERRSSGRTHVGETTIFTKDGIFTALLENVSMGGLFLRTNKPIEVGELIEITIPLPSYLPDGRREKIVVDAVAVRIEDYGVAFRFHEIDDDISDALFLLTEPHPSTLTH